jgi:hypothetical protein
MPTNKPLVGDDAKDAAAERLVAFQYDALPEMQIATTEDLDVVCDVISDAMLAHVLATSPWRQRTKAALPVRVQELLRKARRNLN